jgi:hypothetical protein
MPPRILGRPERALLLHQSDRRDATPQPPSHPRSRVVHLSSVPRGGKARSQATDDPCADCWRTLSIDRMSGPAESNDPGFLPGATRDALVDWLRANGGFAEADIPSEPGPTLSGDERERELWIRARSIAMIHAPLHGVPSEVRDIDSTWRAQPHCDVPSCKVAGASYALLELSEHCTTDAEQALVTALLGWSNALARIDVDSIESRAAELLKDLDEKDGAMRDRAAQTAADLESRDLHERAAAVRRTIQVGGSHASGWRGQLGEILTEIQLFRSYVQRPRELAASIAEVLPLSAVNAGSRSSGLQRQTLLTSLVQHLRKASFTYDEVNQLVVGMPQGAGPDSHDQRKNRLHQRTRGDDRRTIRPFEDEPGSSTDPTDGV